MCRDNSHGGRRCPHDTSEARRLRRHNAGAKAEYAGQAHKSVVASADIESVSISPTPSISIETVKEKIAELDELKAEYERINLETPPWVNKPSDPNAIAEERVSRFDMLTQIMEKQEAKLVEIGDSITQLAVQRTGQADDAISSYVKERGEFLNSAIDKIDEVNIPKIKQLEEEMKELKANASDALKAQARTAYDWKYVAQNNSPESAEAEELLTAWNAKQTEIYALKAEAEPLKVEARQVLGTGHPVVVEMLKKNADTYKEILSEIRPLGGEIQVSDNSDKKKTKVLQAVADIYPAAWIEASNKGVALRVKKTTARAHYTNGAYQKSYKLVSMDSFSFQDSDWTPDPNDGRYSDWKKVEGEEYVKEDGYTYSFTLRPNQSVWISPKYEIFSTWRHRSREGVPVGNGWQSYTYDSTHTAEDGTKTVTQETGYRRVRKERKMVEAKRQAELLIDGDMSNLYLEREGSATAIHEFAHRVEATSGGFIPRMEEQFLRRRTTAPDGTREKLTVLYTGKKEVARPDNFVSDYIGKEYNDIYREVLSMGAEAIFGGNHGGLQGASGRKSDPDMKSFILGLFAAA